MTAVETAKMIRPLLKTHFPDVKFSVTSNGGSVNIHWTDFPVDAAVRSIVDRFKSVSYDARSGEILSGGNLFIFASNEWSSELRAEFEKEIPEGIERGDYEYLRHLQEIANKKYLESLGMHSPNGFRARYMIENYTAVMNLPKYESHEIGSYTVQRIDGGYNLEYRGHRFYYADAETMIQNVYEGMHENVEPILTPEQQKPIKMENAPLMSAEVISLATHKAQKWQANLTPVERLQMQQLTEFLAPAELSELVASGVTIAAMYERLAQALADGVQFKSTGSVWAKQQE